MPQEYGEFKPEGYPPLLDAALVAKMLLTDVNQVRKWANAGVIPCHFVPGIRRYEFVRDEIIGSVHDLSDGSTDEQ